MIRYKCVKNGVVTNVWTSDFAGADYYEDCFGTDYVIEQEDITAEVELEHKKQQALAAQAKGAEIIAYVWALNDSKGATPEQIKAMLIDPTLQQIQQLLWLGALHTAKGIIQAYENPFYTAQDKAALLALFD